MKKTILLFLLCYAGIGAVVAQVAVSPTEKLALTAKVWGFLKYYHPAVGKGEVNWDHQLFAILPRVNQAVSKEELSDVFEEWIHSLGAIRTGAKPKETDPAKIFDRNFDLSWTQDSSRFTQPLSQLLRLIEQNRFQGKHHYIGTNPHIGNIKLTNEAVYSPFDATDDKLRLLSLFRYWNLIEYFFPYKYQTDQNWDEVLNEMIPKFQRDGSESAYRLAMLELTVKIDDSHATYYSESTNAYFGKKWIPAKFKLIDGQAIITGFYGDSLAQVNDLQLGDMITAVDGKSITEIINKQFPYINGSNFVTKSRNAIYAIFNGSSDSLDISFFRDDTLQTKTIARYDFRKFNYQSPKREKWKEIEPGIGYVHMGTLNQPDVGEMFDELWHTRAIIFDLRNYPNETIDLIMKRIYSERRPYAIFTRPDLTYPGKFIWIKAMKCGKRNKAPYPGKVIVLINEMTQSQAEFTAMAFQASGRAILMGSQTAGADGNVSRFTHIDEVRTQISGVGVFYPDGRETQRIGIVPDVYIIPTIEGILAGKDEVLEKALELCRE